MTSFKIYPKNGCIRHEYHLRACVDCIRSFQFENERCSGCERSLGVNQDLEIDPDNALRVWHKGCLTQIQEAEMWSRIAREDIIVSLHYKLAGDTFEANRLVQRITKLAMRAAHAAYFVIGREQ